MAKDKGSECKFCGAEDIYLPTPYVTRVTHDQEYTFCCQAQKKNREYMDNKSYPLGSDKVRIPSEEEVDKW